MKARTASVAILIMLFILVSASAAVAEIAVSKAVVQKAQMQNIVPGRFPAPPPPIDGIAQERIFAKEDELKEDELKTDKPAPVTRTKEARISMFRAFIQKYLGSRIRVPPDATPAYPIELSPEDRANPLLSSADIAKYQRFQSANRGIFAEMAWANRENPSGRSIMYSRSAMQGLAHYIALLEAQQPFPLASPPAGFDVPWGEHLDSTRKFYTEEEALSMWLPHIALSLYAEVNHLVPWSMLGYNEEQRSFLLDGRKFINYQEISSRSAYSFALTWENGGGLTGITDWNPFYSYDFLNDNSMMQPTQQETIYAFTQWIRENIIHESASNAYALHLAYGYNGSYPVDKVLNPPAGQRHWTQGCSGTSSLYSAMLKTINIPVSINLTLGGHRAPLFPTANLALMHGDDPYGTMNRRGLQEVPVEEIFVPIEEFYSMNHAEPERYDGTHMPTRADMAGYLSSRRAYTNAYEHMAYQLLKKRAEDVIMYLPRGLYNSTLGYYWLNESWRPIFDPEEVPVMLASLDAEIMRIGEGDYTLGNLRVCRGLIPRPGYC